MPYQILERTADARIYVSGKTPGLLFTDAVLGMMALVRPKVDTSVPNIMRVISVEAADQTALLVGFLNAVLIAARTNKEAYEHVRFIDFSEKTVRAQLYGRRVTSFDADVKAVTRHEANVKQNQDGIWETNIVFDI